MDPPAAPGRLLPANVKLLGLASLLNDIASEMIYPLLPALLEALGGGKELLGLIEGVADSAASLLKLWSGGRSDRAGRRKGFIVAGYALAVLTRPLLGLVASPWQLLLLRLADRTGKGVRTAPRDALIADSTDPGQRGRAFGFHRSMDHLGAAVGPLLGLAFLWLWPGEERMIFLLTVVPGLLVLALLAVGLREAAPAGPPPESVQLTLTPFSREFRLYLVALLVFTLGNASDAFLLVRLRELGVPDAGLLVLWSAFHVVKSASNYVLGGAADRLGARQLLLAGWLIYGGIYLGFGLAVVDGQVWGLFLAYALFYGLTEPAEKALAADLAGAGRKGLAFGWFNLAVGIATFPASLLFGVLYGRAGPLAAFGTSAGLALSAVLLLLLAVRPRRARA